MWFTPSRLPESPSTRPSALPPLALVSRLLLVSTAVLVGALLLVGGAGCNGVGQSKSSGEFQQTPSGLKYRIRRAGSGPFPVATSLLRVRYRGWLDDGTVFDSTYDKTEPTAMYLEETIEGWKEGLPLCRQGGAIELVVPPELGYGEEGNTIIPPNATLHFLVELEDVLN